MASSGALVLRGGATASLRALSIPISGKPPEGDLAHPPTGAGLHDEGPDARGLHPHPEMRERAIPEGVFLLPRFRGGDGGSRFEASENPRRASLGHVKATIWRKDIFFIP